MAKKVDFSLYKPNNELELKNYLKLFAHVTIPDVAVMPDSIPPFQFISDIFFGQTTDAVAVAGRGSGKTQNFALIAWLMAKFNPNIEVDIVGAIQQQAKKAYSYVREIAPKYSDCESSLMSSTTFTNGSQISILSGSLSSLNSPHPQVALYDEIELTDKEHIEEFENMPISKDNFPAVEILTSSLKYTNGVLSDVLNDAGYELTTQGIVVSKDYKPTRKLYLWTAFDAARKCTMPNCDACKKIIRKQDGKSFYDVCQGRLRKANGFIQIKDLQKKFLKLDKSTFESQILSKKAQPTDLIYPWIQSSIEEFPVDPEYVKQYMVVGGLDFGGNPDPNVLVLAYLKSHNMYLFDEIYTHSMSPSQFMEAIKVKIKPYRKVVLFADPSGKSFFREGMNHGLKFYDPVTRDINEGINYINGLGFDGKIHINKRLFYLIRELTNISKKRGIIKAPEGDHAFDASRYMITSAMTIYGGKKHEPI